MCSCRGARRGGEGLMRRPRLRAPGPSPDPTGGASPLYRPASRESLEGPGRGREASVTPPRTPCDSNDDPAARQARSTPHKTRTKRAIAAPKLRLLSAAVAAAHTIRSGSGHPFPVVALATAPPAPARPGEPAHESEPRGTRRLY